MNYINILLCALVFSLLTATAAAQTAENRLGISAGGGPQDYLSNVGNGFKFTSDNSWHGAAAVHVGTYMNPSLDLVFAASVGDLGTTRLQSVGALLRYKFANDYLLEAASTLKPYVYLGASFNNLSDRINKINVKGRNYMSVNIGLGVRYYILDWVHIGYNLGTGILLVEAPQAKAYGDSRELFLHNAIMVGVDIL